MSRDCDYIKTFDDIIFIVKGYYHPPEKVRVVPVFFPDKNGDRIERATGKRFRRRVEEHSSKLISKLHPDYLPEASDLHRYGVLVLTQDIITHYTPQSKMKECWDGEIFKGTKWENLILSINEIGQVPIEDIGIYGSFLVGLGRETSDIDLVIYGRENLSKLRKKFDLILKNAKIKKATDEQRLLKSEGWSEYCPIDVNRIFKIEKRKWSRVNIYGEETMCIRFVYKKNEIPPNPITTPPIKEIKTKGEVLDSTGTHFCPRIAKVKIDDKVFDIITYYWLFFSCVYEGDVVEIFGNYRKDGRREYITLDKPNHYISPISL
ncbi:nucleotidyltransferase domain-containing protein [Patescibacteria group bacterium]|nr:nucleotidyltransferase domain-containing protein [Patescibacteria group bacterium]